MSGTDSLDWNLEWGPGAQPAEAARVEGLIWEGACGTGTLLWRQDVPTLPGQAVPFLPPELDPGDYCFEVRAYDTDCVRIAGDSVEMELPADAPIRNVITATGSTIPSCVNNERCVASTCVVLPPDRCTPFTCAELEIAECGVVSDGCDGTLDCGACMGPESCGLKIANQCGCAAVTCEDANATCGEVDDGCGGTLDCGSCSANQVCDAESRRCVCTPREPCRDGECGSYPDGCGGMIECEQCAAGLFCGLNRSNTTEYLTCDRIPCMPIEKCPDGGSCGVIPDGCGGTLDCGRCNDPETCGGGTMGRPNFCGCTPITCALAKAECGTIPDGCGGVLDCGGCRAPQTCGARVPNECDCVPRSCSELGVSCGTASNGCGGTVGCGGCGVGRRCIAGVCQLDADTVEPIEDLPSGEIPAMMATPDS